MVFVILIGFGYQQDRYLPSVHVDLYHVYRYWSLRGSQSYVLTDITEDLTLKSYSQLIPAVADNIIDVEIASFVQTLRSNGHYYQYRSLRFLEDIRKIFTLRSPQEKGFVYFTGHGSLQEAESLLEMPDKTFVTLSDLHRILFEIPDITIVYDCCHLNIKDVPYRYCRRRQRFCLEYRTCFPQSNILILGASHYNEEAKTTQLGSLFTRYLFDSLSKGNGSLSEIMSGYREMSLYASFPSYKRVPAWILRENYIDISFDHTKSLFEIHKSFPVPKKE